MGPMRKIVKYSDKYPEAKPSQETESGLFLTGSNNSCCMCGKPTPWIDVNMRDFICSEECAKAIKEAPKQYTK